MTIAPEVLIAVMGAIAAGLGKIYTDLRKDRDFFRDLYLRAVRAGETAADLIEKPDV